jgi:hypothetical protein
VIALIHRILTNIHGWPEIERQHDPGGCVCGLWMDADDPRHLARRRTLLALGRLALFEGCQKHTKFRARLDEISQNEANVFFALNNSLVGASKFLQFAAAIVFPIWDSRGARNLVSSIPIN